jgi:hypothetical protein
MAQVIAAILAIAKAVPVIDKWLEQLLTMYATQKEVWQNKANKEALERVFKTQDQREIEHEDYSGKPSGHGTVRTDLPGVRQSKQSKSSHLVE